MTVTGHPPYYRFRCRQMDDRFIVPSTDATSAKGMSQNSRQPSQEWSDEEDLEGFLEPNWARAII